ncbi:hypothetical protein BTS2_2059 [Bacillus sp. TS-2]|nr:hypothetical protein BTS2_2059 [Bacillus sp. TS-2]
MKDFNERKLIGIAVQHTKATDKNSRIVDLMTKYLEKNFPETRNDGYHLIQVYPENFINGVSQEFITFLGVEKKRSLQLKQPLLELYVPRSRGYHYLFEDAMTNDIDKKYEEIYEEFERNAIELHVNYDFEIWKKGRISMYFPIDSENILIPKAMSSEAFFQMIK